MERVYIGVAQNKNDIQFLYFQLRNTMATSSDDANIYKYILIQTNDPVGFWSCGAKCSNPTVCRLMLRLV
jgi:hypothetical protein